MDRTITAVVDASPTTTMAALSDLSTYPQWLSLVVDAQPDTTTSLEDDAVWIVTLRARLGPLARSKRLRMKRTSVTNDAVRFERAETDGRDHAEWILDAGLDKINSDQCEVKVHLHYGGALWSAPLEIVLSSFEGSAADRLGAYLSGSASS